MRIRYFIARGVLLTAGSIVILCRNPTLNPADFFDRTFEEYKNGFAANGICRNTKHKKAFSNDDFITGEGWLGLEKMHKITSKKMYRLKITLTSRNWTEYVGYYDWMKVGGDFETLFNCSPRGNNSSLFWPGHRRKSVSTPNWSVPCPLLHPWRRAQSWPLSSMADWSHKSRQHELLSQVSPETREHDEALHLPQGLGPGREQHDALCERNVYQSWRQSVGSS